MQSNRKGEHYSASSGIQMCSQSETKKTNRLKACLIKGLLIFSGLYGTIGCYASSFNIDFNQPVLILFLIVISMYASFLYYNRLTLNIGYIVLLLLFIAGSVQFRGYASSGFSAILNVTYDAIDQKYSLPAVRHFPEIYADRYVTVTIALLFIGTFAAIVLNCLISAFSTFWGVFLITFPFIQIGLYFERLPSLFCITLVLACWTGVAALNKGYRSKTGRGAPGFVHKYRSGHHYLFSADGNSLFKSGLFSLLLTGAIVLMTILIIPERIFTTPSAWNRLKNNTDKYVEYFMITGLSGLFNQYDAAGGVSGGRLGGVSSIRPDFNTDLIVDMVPVSYGTVYLKAFTGSKYKYDHWEGEKPLVLTPANHVNKESLALADRFNQNSPAAMRTKFRITNKGAAAEYLYLPYYTVIPGSYNRKAPDMLPSPLSFPEVHITNDVVSGISALDKPYEATCYPAPDNETFTGLIQNQPLQLNSFVKSAYLQIPSDIRAGLLDFCESNGLFDKTRSFTAEQLSDRIGNLFAEQYPYTMNPGLTPDNQDFVTYFLRKQKKGFCIHFASAAALIFRLNGIPSRYVEGYAIPYSKVTDSDLLEEEAYEDWFQGTSPIGKTAVVEVEVNDSLAHAWVEIYKDDFGWIPVDLTPASEGPDETNRSFWSFFSDLFGGSSADTGQAAELPSIGDTFFATAGKIGSRMLLFLYAGIVLLILLLSAYMLRKRLVRSALLKNHRYDILIIRQYHDTVRRLYRHGWLSGLNLTGRQSLNELKAVPDLADHELDSWIALAGRACYGPGEISRTDWEYFSQAASSLKDSLH